MSSPGSTSLGSPASSLGSPSSQSRQATSNGLKFIVGGALMLMSGASLYVAVTSNFVSIPELHNAPTLSGETQERHLNEEKLPWKIREPRPWRINMKEKSQQELEDALKDNKKDDGEQEQNDAKVSEKKVLNPPVEKKDSEKKVLNPPVEKKDHILHVPVKKSNETEKKVLASQQQPETKAKNSPVEAHVNETRKEAPKQQAVVKQEKNVPVEAHVNETRKEAPKPQPIMKQEKKVPESPKQEAKQNEEGQAKKGSSTNKKKKPLNILLLYGDDWRHDSIGSASNGLVKTPFLDDLATQGVRFTHNCVTTSVCWVSRATLYTGQYVSRHKSTEPMKPEFYKGWNQTFPYLLREAGYYFGHVGKWHFKDYTEFVKPQIDWERFYYGRHWFEEREGPVHATKKNERDAIQFLKERPKDKPFCLTVCFFTPHAWDGNPEQFLPQNESLALYVNDTIPVAPSATEEAWKKMPKFFGDRNEGRNRFFWRFDTPDKYQKMMKNYYRLISEIDQTSERIVKELENQGLLDETLIIFTTDNGFFHAEHGLADKWYPYQESIRVPMIVRDPRMAKDKIGKLNDEYTLSIDLAPTILGAAGLPTPDVMHGQDFSPLYTKEGDTGSSWRKEFFYEHPVHLREDVIPASEALVRKDYKYILWPNYDVEQLFDLKNDTYELNDLIESESHKVLLDEMRTRFNELKKVAK